VGAGIRTGPDCLSADVELATLALWLLALALVVVGLAGVVLPALPGVPLLFAGLVVAAWAEGFAYVGGTAIALLALLALLAYGADLGASALGARRFGASRSAVVGATLGTLAGLFLGLPGVLLGPFVGAVVGELLAHRDLGQAGRAGVGAWLGLLLGVAAKLSLSFAMLGVFAIARFV
jgi:uncharacterized protein YqgC (DUF456 family)